MSYQAAVAGWYPASDGSPLFQYWDGGKWSKKTATVPAAGVSMVTTLPLEEAQARVVQGLSAARATIMTNYQGSVTGVVSLPGSTNGLTAVVLFLLCVVPFIIYLISSNRTTHGPFAVQFAHDVTGTRVTTSGHGPGVAAATAAALALPTRAHPQGWPFVRPGVLVKPRELAEAEARSKRRNIAIVVSILVGVVVLLVVANIFAPASTPQ